MTVAALEPYAEYAENGVTTAFAVPFRFLTAAYVKAQRTDADGVVTALEYGVDYTVTGGATDAGGELTVTAAAATGVVLAIWRETPLAQEADYDTNDTFPAESHELALDRGMMAVQEQARELGRALKMRRGEDGKEFSGLADATEGAILGFDEDSDAFVPMANDVWNAWRDDAIAEVDAVIGDRLDEAEAAAASAIGAAAAVIEYPDVLIQQEGGIDEGLYNAKYFIPYDYAVTSITGLFELGSGTCNVSAWADDERLCEPFVATAGAVIDETVDFTVPIGTTLRYAVEDITGVVTSIYLRAEGLPE